MIGSLLGGIGNGQYWQTYSQVYGSAAQIASAQAQQRAVLDALARQMQAQQQAAVANAFANAFNAYREPETIEDAGVRVGEVMGWRCWLVREGWLYSVHMNDVEWEPGKDMEAHEISHHFGDGIHAFKTRRQAQEYGRFFNVVIGRVALWGQIYEFERGWHGEFARVYSLNMVSENLWRRPSWWQRKSPEPVLQELRRTYNVQLTDPEREGRAA